MAATLVCWKCGGPLADLPLPWGRRETCPGCGADLHVCRMCRFYDPGVSRACGEPVAEPVADKERANFCGYFEAAPGAHRPGDRAAARAELDELFGGAPDDAGPGAPGTPDEAKEQLDRLFGKPDKDKG